MNSDKVLTLDFLQGDVPSKNIHAFQAKTQGIPRSFVLFVSPCSPGRSLVRSPVAEVTLMFLMRPSNERSEWAAKNISEVPAF